MILKCPHCGEQYEILSKGPLAGFTMKCHTCGTEISADADVRIMPLGSAYVTAPQQQGKISRWKWVLSILAIIVAIMMLTRPSKEKHAEKVREIAMQVMNQNMLDKDGVTQDLAFLFGPWIMDRFMDVGLQIDDYFLFNVGRIKYEDLDWPITVGLFGNVIPLVDKDRLKNIKLRTDF